MELRTLRVFVEVVRQGGFSQAARVVFATQPTISKAVKHIEDELGVPLLDRAGHRNELTAAGEIVYRRALTMLAEREDLITELDELRGLKRGTLRLGLPLLGSSQLYAPSFVTFRSRYPGIDIHLVERGSKTLGEMLLAGEVDLASVLLPIGPDFEWQPVRREPLTVLLPLDHPVATQTTTDLASLATSSFILFEEGFALNPIILAACERRGFVPKVVARSGQIDFIFGLVAAGMGVAFLPRMIAEERHHPGVNLVLLDEPRTEWHMGLVWRRGRYLSHAARAWLAVMRDANASPGAPTGQGSILPDHSAR
jgi:DNA-binding transcriptional LysR family regulator